MLTKLIRSYLQFLTPGIIQLGGGGSSPEAPDYKGAAEAQAGSSKEVTNMQTYANRPTQNTPFGSVTWGTSSQIDPSTGQPVTTWEQNYNLTPQSQRALDSQLAVQQGRSDLAQSFMGRVNDEYAQPFNWGGLPQRGGNVQGSNFQTMGNTPQLQTQLQNQANGAERQRIENAMFERMRPLQEQAQSGLDVKLANQGLTPGSEAYKRAQQSLGDQQSRERFNALEVGGQEMARMQNMQLQNAQFGNTAMQNQNSMNQNNAAFNNQVGQNQFAQGMQQSQYQNQLRNAALAEEMQRRGMSLNEMNALLTGQQVGMQQMPNFNAAAASQATQYMPAAQAQYQSSLDSFNAQNQNANSQMSGMMNMAGSLGSAAMFAFSDSRLKKIIKRVGEVKGVPLYLFKYLGSETEHIGPIAQEVQKVHPEMVKRHQNGYLMVNYSKLMEA